MSFYLKYELARLLHADGAKTFQAIEKSTRRNVLLHLVDKSASPQIVEQVKKLEKGRDRDLVEVGEFAGSYYVVTSEIENFEGLRNWLEVRVAEMRAQPAVEQPAPPSAPPTRRPPRPPASGGGEFTQLFGAGADGVKAKSPPPPTAPTILDPPAAEAPRHEPPAAPPVREAGELARLFGGDGRETPPQRPSTNAVPQPPPATPAAPSNDAGGFTRMFGDAKPEQPATPQARPAQVEAPAPPPPPAASPKPPLPSPRSGPEATKSEPGEFTRLFGGSGAAPAGGTRPSYAPPASPPDRQGGDFTNMFGSAGQSSPSATPSPAPPAKSGGTPIENSSGEFTRLFGNSGGSDTPAPRLKPTLPRSAGDIEKSSGEFTRLFGPSGKGGAPSPKTPSPSRQPPMAPIPDESGGSLGGSIDAPGDFTLMFGRGKSHSSTDYGAGAAPLGPQRPAASFGEGLVGEISGDEALAPDPGQRASKSSKPFQAPGEFTRMFGPSDPSQHPPEDLMPAAQRGGGEGYASGLFRNPRAEPRRAAGLQRPSGAATPQNADPGDYTMRFERGSATPVQGPKAAGAPEAAAEVTVPAGTKPGKGMLIALIAAVLIAGLALGAAVYLFLNRASDTPNQDAPPAAEQSAEPAPSGGN